MFDEMPDHFYHFLAATTTTPTSPASFSLHHQGPTTFDPSPYSLCPPPPQQGFLPPIIHHHPQLAPLHLHQLKNEDKEEGHVLTSEVDLSWSNDEMLALLRVRATLDNNWFPDFIWENVSRKLAELGFKRSAEKCKEKFEEETRKFSSNNNCITKNNCVSRTIQSYRLFGELEDLCNNHHPQHHHTIHDEQCAIRQLDDDDKEDEEDQDEHRDTGNDNVAENHDSKKTEENTKIRKRKRQNKFEMFKEYCENIVNKMIAQQEQLHFMILRDMVKRDEEKIAREEAWKKEEIERIQNEMEVRAHELAIVGDRQAKIISLLNNFTSSSTNLASQSLIENLLKVHKYTSSSTTTSSLDLTQDSIVSAQPTSSSTTHDQIPNKVETSKLALSQNPNENNSFKFSDHTNTNAADQHKTSLENLPEPKPKPNTEDSTNKDDIGRRWPRDEVLALINIRCNLLSMTSSHDEISKDDHDHSIVRKGIIPPLWERISQRMKEMGYKRNAKRCKEKWENINKYFRKTKDLNKKRSIDSRTCPYFHQLSHLYSQTDNQTLPGSPEIK